MVVHVREAWPDVLRVLDEGSAEHVVIHCFSGDADIARECAARGYFMSFAGNVTYPKNEHLRQAAAAVPIDRLLVETDSPFLSPQKKRGTDNHPSNVMITLAELATVRERRRGNPRRRRPRRTRAPRSRGCDRLTASHSNIRSFSRLQ